MGLAHQRKKEPERVRRAILESAATVAAAEGFTGLSLDAVARAAGITKGGLIHHFPSKQLLLDAICAGLIATLDERMEAQMAGDPVEWGRFTRAYVALALSVSSTAVDARDPWVALCAAAIHIPELQYAWSFWIQRRLERHRVSDSDADLQVARLAADGAWLQVVSSPRGRPPTDFTSLRERLLALASRH
jgi:AcrR family transcriptional regulator